jgi:ribosomal peptide maturation radical SAM protein 1
MTKRLQLALVQMPFAALQLPSIALAQLRQVLAERFDGRVEVRTLYANLDFAECIGLENYLELTALTGEVKLGEWLFRPFAFPDATDNREEYEAYFTAGGGRSAADIERFLGLRSRVATWLDDFCERFALAECRLVGFTSMFNQYLPPLALAHRIKQVNSEVVTVLGGAVCEAPMGEVIARNVPQIDHVFSGSALASFPNFIADCFAPSTARGAVVVEEKGEERDINEVVDLDYTEYLKAFDSFRRATGFKARPVIPFELSRGCWRALKTPCTFCGLNPEIRFDFMTSERAVAYLQELMDRHAPWNPVLEAVDNVLPPRYVREVFPQLHCPEGTDVFYEVRSSLEAKDLRALAAAGVTIVQPGIESLNSTALEFMSKGVDAFTNVRFLKACIEEGVYPIWPLLHAIPEEVENTSLEKFHADIPRLMHLPHPSGTIPISIDRYSHYFNHAEDYGFQLTPHPFYKVLFPFDPAEIERLAYHFIDARKDPDYIRAVRPWTGPVRARISEWISRFLYTHDFPRLYLDNNEVLDTRSGTPRRLRLSDFELGLLDFLERPATDSELRGWAGLFRRFSLRRALRRFLEAGLLFEENGRVMSLVCRGFGWTREGYLRREEFVQMQDPREHLKRVRRLDS